ncbi:MAG: hypothetical protein IIA53_11055 [Chloroflexi bacterium]|nr:hypothetical protein [Chloroflexota bacterium]
MAPQMLEEWTGMVEQAIDRLPWFGLPPFQPTVARNPRQNHHFRIYYDRRVLISWLVGRPVSEVAKRAGCSIRYVYEVLYRVIYRDSYTLEIHNYLNDLGLFAVIDAPSIPEDRPDIEFNLESYGSRTLLEEIDEPEYWTAVGVCLVCHRVVVLLANDDPQHNLEEIPFERYIDWLFGDRMTVALGHLACHFFLEIPWSAARLFGPKSRFPNKAGSLALGIEAISVFQEWSIRGSRPLTPVVNGTPIDIEKARRWWLGMLSGRKSSYPKG